MDGFAIFLVHVLPFAPLLLLGMMQEGGQQQSRQPFEEMRRQVNMLIGCCQIISKPFHTLLRKPGTWGPRHADHQMVFGSLFLFLFAPLFWPAEAQLPMLGLFVIVTLLLFVHRIAGLVRGTSRGVHSRYSGRPWIPGDEIKVKCFWEPLVLTVTGFLLFGLNAPMASYLVLTGTCLGIAAGWQSAADSAILRQIQDARLEQEWLMERMKEQV